MRQNMVRKNEVASGMPWQVLGGGILLVVGGLFLVENLFGVHWLENWWSLFILLPGMLLLGIGLKMLSGNRRFAFLPRLFTGCGLIIVTVALLFALDLNWDTWWPLMIVMPGAAIWLVGGARYGAGLTAVLRLGRWLGSMMILLGMTFLLDQHQLIDLLGTFGRYHWWGLFIMIPALGAFIEGVRVIRQSTWAGMSLFVAGVWITSSGLMEIFALSWLSWEGMVGLGLIGTGLLSRGWLYVQPEGQSD